MRISIKWLKEFVNFKGSTQDIADQLTMLGLEAEEGIDTSSLGDIIIAEVKECIKHPNADKLSLCEVFDGKKKYSVVCGAPNVNTGQKIAFAPVGAVLPSNFKIGKAKIRGKDSQGMICSEKELGISDDHDGIMILDNNAESGVLFIDYIHNQLASLELDITPNRPDCFSHLGVARDLAAQLNKKVKTPDYSSRTFKKNDAKNFIRISFENPDDCPRYIAGIFNNVKVKPSPDWLKSRLESIGQRSINNLVDISNLVLMEMGHPTHIFDYDKLGSKHILIRKGKKGEKITTLDEVERKISPNELLITNGKKPIAIAGIMGGLDTAVSENTSTVLIESAYFDASTVRKGAKALGMSTDASKRFERGADPNGAENAFWRIVNLIEEIAEGVWVPGIVDPYPKKIKQNEIKLTRKKLDILSGCKINDSFVLGSLNRIGCTIKGKSKLWTCKPPSWRPDIEREVDLIEEIIRIYGYDKVPSKYHYEGIMNSSQPDPHKSLSKIISILSGQGFTQVFNNTLESNRKVSILDFESVKIMNPLSDSMSQLRTSLFQGLLETADFNVKNGNPDLLLFEWGNVFEQKKSGFKGIREKFQISGLSYGNLTKPSIHFDKVLPMDFYFIKGIVDHLFSRLNIKNISYNAIESNLVGLDHAHAINVNDNDIGYIGELSPKFSQMMNLDINSAFGFQFDLNALIILANQQVKYHPIVSYPVVVRDLNFVIDESLIVGDLISTINKNGQNILFYAEPINIFRDKSLGKNKKSITINLVFQSSSKTLEDKDVNSVIDEIIRVVSKKYSAILR